MTPCLCHACTDPTELKKITEHTLKIISFHDVQAVCSCGGWSYTFTGAKTRWDIMEEFKKHYNSRCER